MRGNYRTTHNLLKAGIGGMISFIVCSNVLYTTQLKQYEYDIALTAVATISGTLPRLCMAEFRSQERRHPASAGGTRQFPGRRK